MAPARIERDLFDNVGATLFEQFVGLFSRPPALQVVPDSRRARAALSIHYSASREPSGCRPQAYRSPDRHQNRYRSTRIGCRSFNRHTEPGDLAPVLHIADCRLPRPVEAGDVLCVDGQRNIFSAVQDADPVLGQQAPHLTGAEVAVPVVVIVGEVGLANARRIAVALARVRRNRGAQEVHFVVALDVTGRVDVARRLQRDAALLGAEAQLVLAIERRVLQRDGAEAGSLAPEDISLRSRNAPSIAMNEPAIDTWMLSNHEGGPLVGIGISAA